MRHLNNILTNLVVYNNATLMNGVYMHTFFNLLFVDLQNDLIN